MNNYNRNSFKQKESIDERLNTSSYCLFAKDDDQKIDIQSGNEQFKPKTVIIKKDKNNIGNSYRLFPHIDSGRNENNERKDLYNKDNNIISMSNNQQEKYNNQMNDNNEFNIEDEENLHSNININNFHIKNNNINNFNNNIYLNDRNIDDKNKIFNNNNNNNQNNYFFNYNNNNNNYNNININQNEKNDFKIKNDNKIINIDIDKKDKKLSQSCLMVNIDNNNYNKNINNLNIKNNNNRNAYNNNIRFNKNNTNIFKNLKPKDIYKKNSELQNMEENINKLSSGALMANKDIMKNINKNMNSKTFVAKKANKIDILKKNQLSKEEKIKREKEEKERSNIREKLKCYLCFGKIYQARICLNCKQMACEKCVKNMIEKYGKCLNCKKESTLESIIPMPFLDDLTSYFINNVENQKNQNNNININNIGNYQNINKEDEDMKDENYSESNKEKDNDNYMMSDIIMNDENNNISFCDEHTDKISEYYCLQCRKYLCSKCLLFFNQKSVEKHKDHLILSINQLKHYNLIDAIDEYNKLCKSKDDLESTKKETSYQIKKLEIRQNRINDILESIKKEMNKKFNEEKEKLRNIIDKTKEKEESIENSVESVPNSFNNIIQRNDLVQGKLIFEDLKKINKNLISKEEIDNKKEIKTNLFIESYNNKNIQVIFPNNGQYVEEFNVINKDLDFISGHTCKLQINLLGGNVNITLLINVKKKFYEENEPKFYGHFEITNSSKKLVFSIFQNQIYSDEYQILTLEFNYREIKDMVCFDNKLDISLFIVKSYYK